MRSLVFHVIIFLSVRLLANDVDSLSGENIYTSDNKPELILQKVDINYSHLSYASNEQNLNTDQSTPSENLLIASVFKNENKNINFSFSRNKNDYSDITLRKKDGSEEKLDASFNRDEFLGSAALTTYINAHNFSFGLGSSITESPYFQSSQQAQYFYRGQYDSYKIGVSLNSQTMNQPENYYINRNFLTQKSPDRLATKQVQFFYEQVISENFKTQITLINGQKSDRPNNTGYILKTGYALNPKLFIRNQIGVIFEDKTELKDNRGRYSGKFFDLEVSYNYSFKFQTTFGYDVLPSVDPNTKRRI